MQVQETTLTDFTSTEDLLKQAMGPSIEPNREEPVIKEDAPGKTTDELLLEAQGIKKEDSEKEDGDESKPEGEKQDPPQEVEKKEPKGKLPDNFSEIVSELEKRELIKGFEDGKYETIEDVIDLLQENDKIKVESLKKQAEESLFQQFTPAMQTVLQYAQKGVRDPAELIPLLTAIDNFDYSTQLDAENPEHHEQIISNALSIQGLSDEVIKAELADLRERGDEKVAQRAKYLKPVLDDFNKKQVEAIYYKKHQEEIAQKEELRNMQLKAKEVIVDSPNLGGIKLTAQEKYDAFMAVAQPDPKTGGFPLYDILDDLYKKGKFDTLTEMFLVGTNKKLYYNKLGTTIKDEMANKTQRALRMQTTGGTDSVDLQKKDKITRPARRTLSLE